MKRSFPCLLALLLLIGGCRTDGALRTNPSPPPVIEMSSPEPTEFSAVISTGAQRSGEIRSPAGTESSDLPVRAVIDRSPEAAAGEDTPSAAPAWQPNSADAFPADEACTDQQLLEKWLAVEGLTEADLEALGCYQLILVSAQPGGTGSETLTVCYERGAEGGFQPAAGLCRMRGSVGKNGIRHDRRRNTNTSPAGLWAIGYAFGNEAPPDGLKLPWRQVTPSSDWVCDEDSRFFNTWQERGDPAVPEGWSEDVEHLEDYPKQYAYACVIDFNRPPDVIPDRGCAIFLHCSEGPTGGCVGLPRADMLSVLKWLNGEKLPYILITGEE